MSSVRQDYRLHYIHVKGACVSRFSSRLLQSPYQLHNTRSRPLITWTAPVFTLALHSWWSNLSGRAGGRAFVISSDVRSRKVSLRFNVPFRPPLLQRFLVRERILILHLILRLVAVLGVVAASLPSWTMRHQHGRVGGGG